MSSDVAPASSTYVSFSPTRGKGAIDPLRAKTPTWLGYYRTITQNLTSNTYFLKNSEIRQNNTEFTIIVLYFNKDCDFLGNSPTCHLLPCVADVLCAVNFRKENVLCIL